jgi:hypothetical protein
VDVTVEVFGSSEPKSVRPAIPVAQSEESRVVLLATVALTTVEELDAASARTPPPASAIAVSSAMTPTAIAAERPWRARMRVIGGRRRTFVSSARTPRYLNRSRKRDGSASFSPS